MIAALKLLFFEVLNALKSSKLFGEEELRMAAGSLLNYRIARYQLGKQLPEKTVEVAVRTGLTIYGAAYVALAFNP